MYEKRDYCAEYYHVKVVIYCVLLLSYLIIFSSSLQNLQLEFSQIVGFGEKPPPPASKEFVEGLETIIVKKNGKIAPSQFTLVQYQLSKWFPYLKKVSVVQYNSTLDIEISLYRHTSYHFRNTVVPLIRVVYLKHYIKHLTGGQCPVCLKEWSEGDEQKQLPCQHKFHPTCILPWLEKVSELMV